MTPEFTGLEHGFCQLFEPKEYRDLLIVVPYPVLRINRPKVLLSKGKTMFDLGDALQKLFDDDNSNAKISNNCMNDVLIKSLHLFLQSTNHLTINQLCDPKYCGEDMNANIVHTDVKLVTDKTIKGSNVTGHDVQRHIDHLHKSSGSLIMIKGEDSMFYGLFTKVEDNSYYRGEDKHYVLIRFENGMYDTASSMSENCPTSIELPSGESVPMYSVRFVANPPSNIGVNCCPNEGLVTIDSMRMWLPTAAHALQIYTRFRGHVNKKE